jgi:hypothetical protein
MEDFIAVVDGRSSLIPEVDMTSPSLKIYIADAVRTLLGELRFLDALPGYLLPDDASQDRATTREAPQTRDDPLTWRRRLSHDPFRMVGARVFP